MKRMIALGGGCYGLLHVSHLLKARAKGRIEFDRIVVVDRNAVPLVRQRLGDHPDVEYVQDTWEHFLYQYARKGGLGPDDEVVPPCIGPHLTLLWLRERINRETSLRAEIVPWDIRIGTPFEVTLPVGTHAVSYALWRCPSTCIEPPLCPAIRGPRDWDMEAFVRKHFSRWTVRDRPIDHCEVFVSRHRAWGVATYPAIRFLEAWDRMERLWQTDPGREWQVLVATVSACHGLLGVLRVMKGRGDGVTSNE